MNLGFKASLKTLGLKGKYLNKGHNQSKTFVLIELIINFD